MYARLTDRGLGIDDIAKLTDRQIVDVYGHERDEDGDVRERLEVQPDGAPPLSVREQDRRALFVAGRALGIPMDQLCEQWRKKYGDEPWEG